MKREIVETGDGSKTIRILDLDENYHSSHGALQEANHVFINYGLLEFKEKSQISIFEMGFGTGLNSFLSAIKAYELKLKIEYSGVEAYPVSKELLYRYVISFEDKDELYILISSKDPENE